MKICKFIFIILLFISSKVFGDEIEYLANDDSIKISANKKDAIGNTLLQALSLTGIPYRWGGNSPETGMDCSGFIRYVFKKSLGINLPRTAREMAKVGKRVNVNRLEPGDLLFFNTNRGSNTHVGMYIGDNKFVVAPQSGKNIEVTELNSSWRAKLNGAKRIVQENEDDEGNTFIEDYQDVRNQALPVHKGKKSKHARHKRKTKNRQTKHKRHR